MLAQISRQTLIMPAGRGLTGGFSLALLLTCSTETRQHGWTLRLRSAHGRLSSLLRQLCTGNFVLIVQTHTSQHRDGDRGGGAADPADLVAYDERGNGSVLPPEAGSLLSRRV